MSKLSLYNNAFLDEMRQTMDPLADQAIADIYQHRSGAQFRETIASLTTNDYTLPADLPESVQHFFEQSSQLPGWADERLIRRGHEFFAKHIQDLLLMLGLLSLPYDYAAANGAQVLYLSERLRYNPGKRLAETGQYVLDVGAPDAFAPSGKGICSAQKVRLIHAAIRYHIVQGSGRSDARRGDARRGDARWNPEWGQPVNQEDMAGTNLSMSLIPVRGMRKLGITVEHDDMIAYIHLWNVASYLMGVDERLLPRTGKEAFWLNKMIVNRQHQPSEAGQALTKSLLDFMVQSAPGNLGKSAPGYMRFLLGDEIADQLALPPSSLPAQWLASPLKGLNTLRSLIGFQAKNYHATQRQLQREMKKNAAEKFKAPSGLTS